MPRASTTSPSLAGAALSPKLAVQLVEADSPLALAPGARCAKVDARLPRQQAQLRLHLAAEFVAFAGARGTGSGAAQGEHIGGFHYVRVQPLRQCHFQARELIQASLLHDAGAAFGGAGARHPGDAALDASLLMAAKGAAVVSVISALAW